MTATGSSRPPKGNQVLGLLGRISPRIWVALVVTVLAIIFIAQNRDDTSISFFWVRVTSPLWFTLLVIFVVGWVAGALMGRSWSKKG